VNEIITSNKGQYNDYYSKGKIKTSVKPTIYYVAQIRGIGTDINTLNYTIMFTDADYTINLVRSVSLRLIAIFFVLVFLAILVIYFWSNHFVKRIRNIQYHIINLPNNKYEEKYVDSSSDEIGVLSRSVEMMREEINHNEETKQEMLQNLSHDFKTPIAVIKSYAEAIQDGVESKDALKIIIEQADNLRNKVNRLLQYNSLEYLTKDKEFEDVNMYELINEVVLSYKYQTNINFILDLEEGIIFKGYRENWSTVISNIVDNAKRFAKTEIKIILRESRVRIYNDGDPIDEQFLNSVFKPYEKGSKGEFGLGMSIVMKTVDFFGMNLSVRNEEYGGVSFIISKEKEGDNENS
jgi:two-component system sensor histidine kinase CssS